MPENRNLYPLEIRLFGTWEARTNGHPLPPLRSRKERWLLALLALSAHTETHRDTLGESLWPDAEKASYYLRRSLFNLRQALGREAARLLSPTPRTLSLDLTDGFCDVLAFDLALKQAAAAADPLPLFQQAVGLYRGPLLPDCQEEWLLEERRQREQGYHNALEHLANLCLQQGQPASAVGWLRRLILSDPYRESAVCALMQTLADSGDRAAMQQVYQELRARLLNDLNTTPAPEIQTLYEQLSQRPAQLAPLPPTSASPSLRHLPVPLTDLIGRQEEIETVANWLQRGRLVTLLGAGGVGKTRLAIAAADAVLPRFSEGVWFVDLAPLQDASGLAETVARTLAIPEEVQRLPEERLEAALAPRSLLLVLDNCEHLQEAVAVLAFRLLSACPHLHILVTSRHTLGVTGEQVYTVPSLALPPPETLDTAEKDPAFLLEYDGIRLFLQRAFQTNPAFHLDRKNGAVIAEICRHLDGIPLAIEMAAARVRSLSAAELNARLSDRFRLLTTGNRGALPRQQTLRATLDWSYDLLTDGERRLLNRLAVFVGGFTQEGAVAVSPAEEEDWCVEALSSLVDKSLLVCDLRVEPPRYRMLETVREYGLERLEEVGETEAARTRHADLFLALAEQMTASFRENQNVSFFAPLESEHDNLRAALNFYDSHEAMLGKAVRLAFAIEPMWSYRSQLYERRYWLVHLANRPTPPTRVRAHLLGAASLTFIFTTREDRDPASAKRMGIEQLKLARQLNDLDEEASALNTLSLVAGLEGDPDKARALAEEGFAIMQKLADQPGRKNLNALRGHRAWTQGHLAMERGEYAEAHAYLQDSMAIDRETGVKGGYAMHVVGNLALKLGNYVEARHLFQRYMTERYELGDLWNVAQGVSDFGALALAEGKAERAARLLGASLAWKEAIESPQPAHEIAIFEERRQALNAMAGETLVTAAWEAGSLMTCEAGMALALEEETPG